MVFERRLRGETDRCVIDSAVINSTEARRLVEMVVESPGIYERFARLRGKDFDRAISGPTALLETVLENGRKGLSIQRYKGLGEMNPEQLWQTTLDPNSRRLLQVKISHDDEVEEVFSTLMGDVVEPRREFIQANAHKVANLDV